MVGRWCVAALLICGACGSGGSNGSATPNSSLPSTAVEPVETVTTTVAPTPSAVTEPEETVVSAPDETVVTVSMETVVAEPGGLDATWRATGGIVDGDPVTLLDDQPITLTVAGTDVSGQASCNGYFGTVVRSDTTIEFEGLGWNETACEPAASMDLERVFLTSVGPTATYNVDGTVLTWTSPTSTWTFDFVPPTPDEPIVGTVWVLSGIVYEFGGMSGMGIDDGHIAFASDGTFTGSTSCRDFTGTWSMDGDTLVAEAAQVVGKCVGAINPEFDATFAQVLTEGFHGTIEGLQLKARPRDDLGLDFMAQGAD